MVNPIFYWTWNQSKSKTVVQERLKCYQYKIGEICKNCIKGLTSTTHEEGPFGKNRTAPLPHEKSDSYKSFIVSRQHGATVQSQH